MIARNPIREKLMCQKLAARKKEAKRAIRSVNNGLARKYKPRTVSVPNMAEGRRKTQGLLPRKYIKAD